MDRDLSLTLELGPSLGVAVPRSAIAPIFDEIDPVACEWSVNSPPSGRGRLRLHVWTDRPERAAAALARLGAAVPSGLALGELDGVGLSIGVGKKLPRFWRLAPIGGGRELLASVARASPALADDGALLARIAGTEDRCRAVGFEFEESEVERSTVYFEVADPRRMLALLEASGCPTTLETNLFFRGFLGMEAGREREWPLVWVGRSHGRRAGWKFYYFARGDEDRPSDRALLEAVAADQGVTGAWQKLRDARGEGPFVQIVGLTLPDEGGPPSFTLYLGAAPT